MEVHGGGEPGGGLGVTGLADTQCEQGLADELCKDGEDGAGFVEVAGAPGVQEDLPVGVEPTLDLHVGVVVTGGVEDERGEDASEVARGRGERVPLGRRGGGHAAAVVQLGCDAGGFGGGEQGGEAALRLAGGHPGRGALRGRLPGCANRVDLAGREAGAVQVGVRSGCPEAFVVGAHHGVARVEEPRGAAAHRVTQHLGHRPQRRRRLGDDPHGAVSVGDHGPPRRGSLTGGQVQHAADRHGPAVVPECGVEQADRAIRTGDPEGALQRLGPQDRPTRRLAQVVVPGVEVAGGGQALVLHGSPCLGRAERVWLYKRTTTCLWLGFG